MLLQLVLASAYQLPDAGLIESNKPSFSKGLDDDIIARHAHRMPDHKNCKYPNLHKMCLSKVVKNVAYLHDHNMPFLPPGISLTSRDIDFSLRDKIQNGGLLDSERFVYYGPAQLIRCEPGVDWNCHAESSVRLAERGAMGPEEKITRESRTTYNYEGNANYGIRRDPPVDIKLFMDAGLRSTARVTEEVACRCDKKHWVKDCEEKDKDEDENEFKEDEEDWRHKHGGKTYRDHEEHEHGIKKHMFHIPIRRDYVGFAGDMPERTIRNGRRYYTIYGDEDD